MKKKSLIGYVNRNWESNFIHKWGVFQFPYTNSKKTKPMFDIVFDNIKVKITIEEIK